jgi:hypothetical protein
MQIQRANKFLLTSTALSCFCEFVGVRGENPVIEAVGAGVDVEEEKTLANKFVSKLPGGTRNPNITICGSSNFNTFAINSNTSLDLIYTQRKAFNHQKKGRIEFVLYIPFALKIGDN